MYRTIDARFWSDPKVRKLTPPAKLLFLYLITNGHTHVGGIYHLPPATLLYETGLPKSALDTLCDTLSSAGLVRFDQEHDLVWVKNMLAYQGRGEKNERAAARHVKTLHKSNLVNEFLQRYPEVSRYYGIGYGIPYPAQDSVGTPEQEQEQEQEQEINSCGEPAEPASPPDPAGPVVLIFPVVGNKERPEWSLTQGRVDRLSGDFPGIDVMAECRKARAWCEANPSRRKTAAGMPKFLVGWLSKATERPRHQNGQPGTPTRSKAEEAEARRRNLFADPNHDQ